VFLGDIATFALGRGLLGRLVGPDRLRRLFPPERLQWAERQTARGGWRAILVARLLVGLRGFVYFALGGSRYPMRRFIVLDALIGTIEVGVVVSVGYLVGSTRRAHERVELVAIVVLALSLLLPWCVHRWLGRGRPRECARILHRQSDEGH
jgi:membrane protein DedA with SNARE-associated domain